MRVCGVANVFVSRLSRLLHLFLSLVNGQKGRRWALCQPVPYVGHGHVCGRVPVCARVTPAHVSACACTYVRACMRTCVRACVRVRTRRMRVCGLANIFVPCSLSCLSCLFHLCSVLSLLSPSLLSLVNGQKGRRWTLRPAVRVCLCVAPSMRTRASMCAHPSLERGHVCPSIFGAWACVPIHVWSVGMGALVVPRKDACVRACVFACEAIGVRGL